MLLKMAEQGPHLHANRNSAVSAFGSSRKTSSRSLSKHGLAQVLQAFLSGFALAVGSRHLQATSPEPALVRFAPMNDRRELSHPVVVIASDACECNFSRSVNNMPNVS
jgi:hypothetical protein